MVAHDTGWRNCKKGSPITKSGTSSLPQKVLVALFASLRVQEWQKLAFFIPLILAGKGRDLIHALSAHGSSRVTSNHILNDLLAVRFDESCSKQRRPLASGELDGSVGLSIVPIGMLASFSFASGDHGREAAVPNFGSP